MKNSKLKATFLLSEGEIRRQAESEGIEKLAVGAGIMKEGKILIVRRVSEDFLEGVYELPGGKVEEGETFITSLYREIKEETCLTIETIEGLFKGFDYKSRVGKLTRQVNFAIKAYDGNLILNKSEHDKYMWLSEEELSTKKEIVLTPEIENSIKDFFEKFSK